MAMARATIAGVIIGEPEKRFTQNNTAVTNFSIQVAPSGNRADQPFTVRVTCWRNLADLASTLQKGQEVVIEGRLQVNQFENAGGLVKRFYEIDASNIFVGHLESIIPTGQGTVPQAGEQGGFQQPVAAAGPAIQPTQQQPVAAGPTWHGENFPADTLLTEDDIPF
jgi:single stranded DNA-binding protein